VAATLTDPLIGHLVDGRYEVLSRVARGGMATVYLAVDRRLDREVALKVMHPHLAEGASGADFQARFRREARAAARLTHPGLVGVLDQGVDGETSYLAMEFVDGTNLRRRLVEEGSLTVDEALRTTEAVLEALSVAHRAQLVHRDIKPENVLISSDGRVKVADFGLARAVTEVTSTTTGTVLGTVAYLAPELVARGASDTRTDVYAIGILLYEMLTGAQPFTGATPIQIAYQHVHSDVPPPSERVEWLPTEVDELVEALAARDPDERPPDAAAALSLVRRTRATLDPALLARRADVVGTPAPDAPPHDPDATALLGLADATGAPAHAPGDAPTGAEGLRRTIALKIGSGVEALDAGGAAPAVPDAGPGAPGAPAPRRRRRGRRVALVVVLALLAALGGAAAWWFLAGPGATQPVPDGLVGVERARAEAILAEVGLTADIAEDFHDTVPVGSVVSTDPPAGEPVAKGGTVTLVVSKGPYLRVVPDGLVGASAEEARAALEAVGFVVPDDVPVHSDTVEAGLVVAVSAEAGESLPYGTEVTLQVSQGPAPIVVPDVRGEERQRAIAVLETEYGLVVTVAEDYSEEVPAGRVMAQSLEPGAEAHRTDAVTITVSLGPPLVEVPDVYGKQFVAAKAQLEELGLVVQRENVLGGVFGTVRDQSIPAGTTTPKGSTIVLTVV